MANTFELISAVTVGSGGASSIEFTSIGSSYTDLVLQFSTRSTRSNQTDSILFYINSSNTGSDRILYGNGSSAGSATDSTEMYVGNQPAATATSSTFSNTMVYIPNYAGSTYKSYSVDSVTEDNSTYASAQLLAGLYSSTSAITSLKITCGIGNFVQYSTAYLYGVKNA